METTELKQEELKEYFCIIDNELYRARGNKWVIVKNGGTDHSDGYKVVQFKNKKIRVHRLKWVLTYGDIDEEMVVDHINGDKSDNRVDNLQLLSSRDNTNKGSKGDSRRNGWSGKKSLTVYVDGKMKHLGVFEYDNYYKAQDLCHSLKEILSFKDIKDLIGRIVY